MCISPSVSCNSCSRSPAFYLCAHGAFTGALARMRVFPENSLLSISLAHQAAYGDRPHVIAAVFPYYAHNKLTSNSCIAFTDILLVSKPSRTISTNTNSTSMMYECIMYCCGRHQHEPGSQLGAGAHARPLLGGALCTLFCCLKRTFRVFVVCKAPRSDRLQWPPPLRVRRSTGLGRFWAPLRAPSFTSGFSRRAGHWGSRATPPSQISGPDPTS